MFTTVFVIAIVLFVLSSNLIRSGVGRGLVAMRDNETGAAVSGVYPAQYKVLAFATSAFVTSIGGGCFASGIDDDRADTFGLQRSIEFIAGLVIGGVATILGPAIGGVLVEWLPYWAFEVDWPTPRQARRTAGRDPVRRDPGHHHLLHARRHRVRASPASFEVHRVRSPPARARGDRTNQAARTAGHRIDPTRRTSIANVQQTTRERFQ